MNCGSPGVTKLLVGLHLVGVVELREAFADAEQSGLTEREALLDHMLKYLAPKNYFPPPLTNPLRRALWREFLRSRGEDFREYFSEIDVTVRAPAGTPRDRFEEVLCSVFRELELKPLVAYAPPEEGAAGPQLVIGAEVIVGGLLSRANFKKAVRKSISDW